MVAPAPAIASTAVKALPTVVSAVITYVSQRRSSELEEKKEMVGFAITGSQALFPWLSEVIGDLNKYRLEVEKTKKEIEEGKHAHEKKLAEINADLCKYLESLEKEEALANKMFEKADDYLDKLDQRIKKCEQERDALLAIINSYSCSSEDNTAVLNKLLSSYNRISADIREYVAAQSRHIATTQDRTVETIHSILDKSSQGA